MDLPVVPRTVESEAFKKAVNDLYFVFGEAAEQRLVSTEVVHTAALHMACVAAIILGATEAEFMEYARETFRGAAESRPKPPGMDA